MTWILIAVAAACGGAWAGYALRQVLVRRQVDSAEVRAREIIEAAKTKSQEILFETKNKAIAVLEEVKREERDRKRETAAQLARLEKREEGLEGKIAKFEEKEEELKKRIVEVQQVKVHIEALKAEEVKKLEEVAHLTGEQAKEALFARLEREHSENLFRRVQKLEQEGVEHLAEKSKEILFTVLQRYAGSHASEITTTIVALPSEDVKGRIIGREGRNIKAFERETGVEVLVDDSPGAITISAFDPIRRQVAKVALERLIADGRIQPARIEEEVVRAKAEIDKQTKEAGDAAVYEVGIVGLDPRLVQLLGRLRFRTSFGQNVLLHSVEAAHIGGMLASELGGNVGVVKKGALLHDIGKAIDHEVEGTHVEIGRKILQKFGVEEAVIKAMQSHHEEYPYETLEAVIVKVAESISAARPGARRDTVENYIKRLEELEAIAARFPGVERSYAIQAGREVRVFVDPVSMDDFQARELAKSIAHNIEEALHYPGEIKVNVIRETRAIEYAR